MQSPCGSMQNVALREPQSPAQSQSSGLQAAVHSRQLALLRFAHSAQLVAHFRVQGHSSRTPTQTPLSTTSHTAAMALLSGAGTPDVGAPEGAALGLVDVLAELEATARDAALARGWPAACSSLLDAGAVAARPSIGMDSAGGCAGPQPTTIKNPPSPAASALSAQGLVRCIRGRLDQKQAQDFIGSFNERRRPLIPSSA